jgi:hypothetical protein
VAFAAVNLLDVCARLRVHTGAPWLPTGPSCQRAIEAGVRVWAQPGASVRLVPLTAAGATQITFRVNRTMASLATAEWPEVRVTYRADECWHTHDLPCAALGRWAGVAYALAHVCLATSLAAVAVTSALRRPRSQLAAVLCVGAAAAAVAHANSVLLWCSLCRSLVSVTAHEVGHLLGLEHPDTQSAPQFRGCGSTGLSCSTGRPGAALMDSKIALWDPRKCLAADDVDALYSLYGGTTDRACPPGPVQCPEPDTTWLLALCTFALTLPLLTCACYAASRCSWRAAWPPQTTSCQQS